jgi:ribosomal protein L16/L10AE
VGHELLVWFFGLYSFAEKENSGRRQLGIRRRIWLNAMAIESAGFAIGRLNQQDMRRCALSIRVVSRLAPDSGSSCSGG